MNESDLKELQRIFPNTTPGKWKLWATQIMADQDGTSNVDTAKHVADFSAPRTWDADMCCILQRNMPGLLADAQALADVRTLIAALDGVTRDIVITEHGVSLQDGGPCFEGTPWEGIAKAAAWVREQAKGAPCHECLASAPACQRCKGRGVCIGEAECDRCEGSGEEPTTSGVVK